MPIRQMMLSLRTRSTSLPLLSRLYHSKVIDHYENPRNVGAMDKNSPNVGTGLVGAPACGDVMKLQIKVDENGKIVDAKFKTFGCGSAIASSSLATEWVKGKTVDQALSIKNTDIAKELCLPPVKLHCSRLDNAGKTTIAKALSGEFGGETVPTVGFQKYEASGVQLFELGGSESIRELWPAYFPKAYGFIFVIDSACEERFLEACETLSNTFRHEHFKGKPLLLLANKQDLEGAAEEQLIVTGLGLDHHANATETPTRVDCCVGNHEKLDPAIQGGFRWLIQQIRADFLTLHSRVQLNTAVEELNVAKNEIKDNLTDEAVKMLEDMIEFDEDDEKNPFLPIKEVIARKGNAWTTTNGPQGKQISRSESLQAFVQKAEDAVTLVGTFLRRSKKNSSSVEDVLLSTVNNSDDRGAPVK